jgi:hypothetical protein
LQAVGIVQPEILLGALMERAVAGTIHGVLIVPKTKTNFRVWQYRQIVILHVSSSVEVMRTGSNQGRAQYICRRIYNRIEVNRSVGYGCVWVQRIRQQGIVPMILVLAKHAVEGVPLVLADANLRYIVGIAAVAKIAKVKVVEKCATMIERANFSCESQQPWPLLQIHQGVVGFLAPVYVGESVAEFDGLLDVVVALVDPSLFLHLLRAAHRSRETPNA